MLHIEVLERQVTYLMDLPLGFKPSPSLDYFLGYLTLDLIGLWNHVTTQLTFIETYLVRYISIFGVLGISF
jgi:hypothetical protein